MEAKGKTKNPCYGLELYSLFVTNQVPKHWVTFGPNILQKSPCEKGKISLNEMCLCFLLSKKAETLRLIFSVITSVREKITGYGNSRSSTYREHPVDLARRAGYKMRS